MSDTEAISECAAKIATLAEHLERMDSGSGDAHALRLCAQYLAQQQADIAALEAERDAALSRAAEYLAKASHAEPVTDADMAWGETMAAGLSRIEAKTYARALEDAAKVADELLSRATGAGSGRNWRDNPNYSGGEAMYATAAAIAAAIRALKPPQKESAP